MEVVLTFFTFILPPFSFSKSRQEEVEKDSTVVPSGLVTLPFEFESKMAAMLPLGYDAVTRSSSLDTATEPDGHLKVEVSE